MMDPTRIHTSPLSSNQYAKQPLASRTFNPNQISLLVFKKINWDDPKGSLFSHDVHQVFTEGYQSVFRTQSQEKIHLMMDPPRIHVFHYNKFNMSTNLLHPHFDNSKQISHQHQISKRSTGMIQKVHLFLMMFTYCSLRITYA